jgi:hypothetical protein
MMKISTCQPYHAQIVSSRLIHMPDGKSVFKIYFVSIIGRDSPQKYEWAHSAYTREQFEQDLQGTTCKGIGFVIAFPHITKVFRFSPVNETVLDVSEYRTQTWQPLDCSRGDGSHEFACYAETIIASQEHTAWANAANLDEYLGSRCHQSDFPVIRHDKLADYWN